MKCTRCNNTALPDFKKCEKCRDASRAEHKRYGRKHKDDIALRVKSYREKNRVKINEYTRRANFARDYGITIKDRDAMFEKQGRVCACCGTPNAGTKKGWHTDHNHVTKTVRGVVCHGCNIMLGGAKDKIENLAKGIEYLGKEIFRDGNPTP